MVDLPITKWIKKKIRRLIAIVEDTDVATHSIASGKYVVWKGDLYKSTAAIAVGGSLSLSNLSPVSDGGLNELSEQIEHIYNGESVPVNVWNASSNNIRCKKYGGICLVDGTFTASNSGSLYNFLSIPISGIKCTVAARDNNTNGIALIYNNVDSESATTFAISGSTQGHSFSFNMCFMIE